jgi:hypothetical protein
MTPTSKLHKHVHNESLWVRLSDAEAIEKELIETQSENTRLRAAIAQGTSACIYCSLPKAEWSKCKSGFPGCTRGDDAMGCPELGASYYLSEMEGNRNEWKKVASLFKTSFDAHLNDDNDLRDMCYIEALDLYEKLSKESQTKS